MRRKVDTILTANIVTLDHDPTRVYLTADGAAAWLTEKRKLDKPLTRQAIEQYTTREQLKPIGYLNGAVPLYTVESLQTLADPKAGGVRRYKRRKPELVQTDAPLGDPQGEPQGL